MKLLITLNKTFLLSLILFQGMTYALANEKTDSNWIKQLKINGIPSKDQAYCYTDENSKAVGSNIDMKIRLASVSKLMVALWSIEMLGTKHKYDTKLFIKGNNLHIQGSYDPFLGNEKMFFLVSQLNELGYEKFDTITFDKNLLINPDAQYASAEEYPSMSAAAITKHLRKFFNTAIWSQQTKDDYAIIYKMAKTGKFKKTVNFEATNFQLVEKNPFENDSEARMLTLTSPSLYKYLKEMNIKSNNYVAETLFRQLGSAQKFQTFLADRFSLTSDQIYFYSGSGLPTYINKERKDNYATCSIMLDLIAELKGSIERQSLELEDIIAVPGSDGGTFRNRIFPADYKNSFVAKTGSLMHTSALAGMMSTKNGVSFFGIFNQTEDIHGAKAVQNSMVTSIMSEMGGPKNFNYVVDGFHTYSDENVKTLDKYDFSDEESDFSSIEANLY